MPEGATGSGGGININIASLIVREESVEKIAK